MIPQDTDDEDKFIVEGIASWGAFYNRGCAFTYDYHYGCYDDDGDIELSYMKHSTTKKVNCFVKR